MDDAAIERIASAVATKIINQRLAELQDVREQALKEGRLAALKEAAALARQRGEGVREVARVMTEVSDAGWSVARRKVLAAYICEQFRDIGDCLEQRFSQEAAP